MRSKDARRKDNNNLLSTPKKSRRGNNGSNTSRRKRKRMYTHRAGDGLSGGVLRESSDDGLHRNGTSPPPKIIHRSFTHDDDSLSVDPNIHSEYCKPTCLKLSRNVLAISVLVLFGQILVSVSLKHFGVIEKDFNEIVTENVVPKLQQQLEETGLSWSHLNESLYWRRINQSLSLTSSLSAHDRPRPGFRLAAKGATAKYPVVMVPGFVTSGLEVWEGKECAKKYFRQRMWGGVGSVQQWLMERHCVMEHLALHPMTGKDPDGIRIRAAQGFEAADYFMGNYWVWGKILENLADIGYDGSMMSMESYDWRLAFPLLEERDGYLTKLKYKIEAFHKSSGKKVVLTSHSLGALLVHYFFAWVTTSEKDGGGGGGKDWVDEHVHTYVNIAGAHLGVPKAASALLSGEMSDTIFMGTVGDLVENFIGRKLRRDLFNTWGSIWTMLPKGASQLWDIAADLNKREDGGDGDHDDSAPSEKKATSGYKEDINSHLIVFADGDDNGETDVTSTATTTTKHVATDLTCTNSDVMEKETEARVNEDIKAFASRRSHSAKQVIDFLKGWGGGRGPDTASSKYHSFDRRARSSPKTWHDITRTPLPHAPNMKVFCLYGVGLPTERAYFYKHNTGEYRSGQDNNSNNHNHTTTASSQKMFDPPFILDTSIEDAENDIIHGVKYTDGDGSVPLLSLGYMCTHAWQPGRGKKKRNSDSGNEKNKPTKKRQNKKKNYLNPSGTTIVTREYKHRHEFSVDDPMRSGPYSADHVDVLGNVEMLEDFLKIVSDFEIDTIEDDYVVSNIHEIAERIDHHPNGGRLDQRRFLNRF